MLLCGNRFQIGFYVEQLTRLGDVCGQRDELLGVTVGYMELCVDRETN
jgi:hypothetical protein